MKIYLDLDGCLADFDRGFFLKAGEDAHVFEQREGSEKFWKTIYSYPTFFSDLPLFSYSLAFWNFLHKLTPHVTILSAPSKFDTERCVAEKKEWVLKHFPNNPPALYERRKHIYANPDSILIDDTQAKISEWRKAGGIGILHNSKDLKSTLQDLYLLRDSFGLLRDGYPVL